METKKFKNGFKCECCGMKLKIGVQPSFFRKTKELWRCRFCYSNCPTFPINCEKKALHKNIGTENGGKIK